MECYCIFFFSLRLLSIRARSVFFFSGRWPRLNYYLPVGGIPDHKIAIASFTSPVLSFFSISTHNNTLRGFYFDNKSGRPLRYRNSLTHFTSFFFLFRLPFLQIEFAELLVANLLLLPGNWLIRHWNFAQFSIKHATKQNPSTKRRSSPLFPGCGLISGSFTKKHYPQQTTLFAPVNPVSRTWHSTQNRK